MPRLSAGGMGVVSAGGTDAGAHISGGTQDVFWDGKRRHNIHRLQVVEAGRTAISTIISGGTQLGERSPRSNAGRRSGSYWPELGEVLNGTRNIWD